MAVHEVVNVVLFCALLVATAIGPVRCRRVGRFAARPARSVAGVVATRWRAHRPLPPRPVGRPFEVVAWHVHRLGYEFHTLPQGASFSRYEGRRQAYDAVLGEACQALGVDHLLGILTPGPDLDRERTRVELVLDLQGLRLDDAA